MMTNFTLHKPLTKLQCICWQKKYKKTTMNKLKILFLGSAMSLSAVLVFAQATPVSTMIEKENRNAVMIVISQPVNITTDALEQKLQRAGLKDKIRKGAGSYKGVILSEISSDKIDLYTKVEPGPNNTSIVYMAVSKGYNNFTNSDADTAITSNVEAFLNSFVKDANNYSADVDISNHIRDEDKSAKKYQKLLDEQKDLVEKKRKIDVRLAEIQTDLDAQKADLDKKKSGVEDAKIKRSNENQ